MQEQLETFAKKAKLKIQKLQNDNELHLLTLAKKDEELDILRKEKQSLLDQQGQVSESTGTTPIKDSSLEQAKQKLLKYLP